MQPMAQANGCRTTQQCGEERQNRKNNQHVGGDETLSGRTLCGRHAWSLAAAARLHLECRNKLTPAGTALARWSPALTLATPDGLCPGKDGTLLSMSARPRGSAATLSLRRAG